ncbi:hypothetical protein LZ554_002438 [Drepanopeziza brunnea f. sp. 'monogermtubi']|nr:hypothetical protein LZ554_002438 [Drepanopeziza brunnea f. sp. 'monogermtubi']
MGPQIEGSSTAAPLGAGFYMLNKPSGWEATDGSWYCAIKARTSRIRKTPKVWIPKDYEEQTARGPESSELWNQDEDVIVNYIQTEALLYEPDAEAAQKALRLSWVRGANNQWQLQMLIPTNVLNNNDLKLWAKCFDSEDGLKKFSDKVIPWDDSTEWNVQGARYYPPTE